MNTIQQYR